MVRGRMFPGRNPVGVNRIIGTIDRTARGRTVLIASMNRGRVVTYHCFGFAGPHDVIASNNVKAVNFYLPTTVNTAFNHPSHAIYTFVNSKNLRVAVRRLNAIVRRGSPIGVVLVGGGCLNGMHR